MFDRSLSKTIAISAAVLATATTANGADVSSADGMMPVGVISQDIALGLENIEPTIFAGLFQCSVDFREANCRLSENTALSAGTFTPPTRTTEGSLANEISTLISTDPDTLSGQSPPVNVTAQPAPPSSQVTLTTPLPAAGFLFATVLAGIAATQRLRSKK